MTFTKNIFKRFSDKTPRTILTCGIVTMITLSIAKEFIMTNFTESEPVGIYLLSRQKQYNRNDIITISNNINPIIKLSRERNYTITNRLVKTILGIPGDNITIRNSIVCINGKIIGKIHTADSQNRPLPSIIKEGIIPPDSYFLASRRHENSFDSRYYGLISKECIQKKASPFLTNQ